MEWVPWQDAIESAVVTAGAWAAVRRSVAGWARKVHPWAKELTFILVLYAMWQYAGRWSLGRASKAIGRGRWIWRVERDVGLPTERWLQQLILGHHALIKIVNYYYFFVHVPALAICLVWLFVRHRDKYPPVRTLVAIVTGASLLIQMVPVAPPRLIPGLHIVDTAAVYGPTVYTSGQVGIDQLSAMPSLHVGWALIVGFSVVWASTSRWRWLALLHPAMTTFTVVATGNHYWSDAIVVAVICAVATLIVRRAYHLAGSAIVSGLGLDHAGAPGLTVSPGNRAGV